MIELMIDKLHDSNFMAMLLAAVAAIATVLTLTMPLLAGDNLQRRMKSVAFEREKLRQRERERMARGEKVSLRSSPKQYMKTIVEQFNLNKWVGQEAARALLVQAGYRGQGPYVAYLFFRLVTPIVVLLCTVFYVFMVLDLQLPATLKILICLFAAWAGMQLPMLFLKNQISRRQLSIRRAFPDALDLLLICVESGMSIETAFRRVSLEIGHTLRVMAQENRDMRMNEAEKKAAALPPKLTVPMILFFLPVLFIVILGPAAIRVMEIK
jgi:tight adherence protein C